MGRTKKVAFTVVTNEEQFSCKNEQELLDTLAPFEDISGILVFAGAPLAIERNVSFAVGGSAAVAAPAKRRGRPPGKKNKAKAGRKSKGPGRPKGSKNKKRKAAAPTAGKKRPGRPKGSKNKPKATEDAAVANVLQQAAQGTAAALAAPAPVQAAAPQAPAIPDATK